MKEYNVMTKTGDERVKASYYRTVNGWWEFVRRLSNGKEFVVRSFRSEDVLGIVEVGIAE